jgi:uncharacterized protein YeeX (DUF496 family)
MLRLVALVRIDVSEILSVSFFWVTRIGELGTRLALTSNRRTLKCIVNAQWYFRNSDLQRDLGIETVTVIIVKFIDSHEKRLQDHINIEASRLVNVNNITRRLKRKKPSELVRR